MRRWAPSMRPRSGHPDRGRVCPSCAGPKDYQSFRCFRCWRDEVKRDDAYWARRTCPDCRGPKHRSSTRCRPCTDDAQRGVSTDTGHPQPTDHPWRKAARKAA